VFHHFLASRRHVFFPWFDLVGAEAMARACGSLGTSMQFCFFSELSKGVFGWWHEVECNGTIPHLEGIPVFS
jgi:hypothetical protein